MDAVIAPALSLDVCTLKQSLHVCTLFIGASAASPYLVIPMLTLSVCLSMRHGLA